MTITSDSFTCECRRTPWVTIAMFGGTYPGRKGETPLVRCPDHDHCLRGAPLIGGRLGRHWRNMPDECAWTGIRVRESMPCACAGQPWVRSTVLRFVFHQNWMDLTSPLRSVSCPGCRNSLVDVEHSRIVVHHRHTHEACLWSGIYIAKPGEAAPLPAPGTAPNSPR